MRKSDSEIFFHKAKLAEVCRSLQAGRRYLVLGPLGIGKSAFLRNIEPYWGSTVTTQEKAFQFWHVDFSRQPSLTTDEAQRFKEEVLSNLRTYARDEERITICLMDHIEAAIIRADVYDLGFFDTIGIYQNWPSLRYVIASDRSLWDQLSEAYHPDPEQRKRYKRPILDIIVLGLVPTEEADTFIVEAGGHNHWKAEMPWLVKHIEAIREIAGCYPLFLERAIEELHGTFGKKRAFDAEEFRREFLERMSDRYQGIWESLDEEEKTLLVKLSRGFAPSEEERTVLERSLRPKALVTSDYKIFSTAFQDFVRARKGYAQALQYRGLKAILRPRAWDREQTSYAMLGMLLLFAVIVPVVRVVWENPTWIVAFLIILFVVIFFVLMAHYWGANGN